MTHDQFFSVLKQSELSAAFGWYFDSLLPLMLLLISMTCLVVMIVHVALRHSRSWKQTSFESGKPHSNETWSKPTVARKKLIYLFQEERGLLLETVLVLTALLGTVGLGFVFRLGHDPQVLLRNLGPGGIDSLYDLNPVGIQFVVDILHMLAVLSIFTWLAIAFTTLLVVAIEIRTTVYTAIKGKSHEMAASPRNELTEYQTVLGYLNSRTTENPQNPKPQRIILSWLVALVILIVAVIVPSLIMTSQIVRFARPNWIQKAQATNLQCANNGNLSSIWENWAESVQNGDAGQTTRVSSPKVAIRVVEQSGREINLSEMTCNLSSEIDDKRDLGCSAKGPIATLDPLDALIVPIVSNIEDEASIGLMSMVLFDILGGCGDTDWCSTLGNMPRGPMQQQTGQSTRSDQFTSGFYFNGQKDHDRAFLYFPDDVNRSVQTEIYWPEKVAEEIVSNRKKLASEDPSLADIHSWLKKIPSIDRRRLLLVVRWREDDSLTDREGLADPLGELVNLLDLPSEANTVIWVVDLAPSYRENFNDISESLLTYGGKHFFVKVEPGEILDGPKFNLSQPHEWLEVDRIPDLVDKLRRTHLITFDTPLVWAARDSQAVTFEIDGRCLGSYRPGMIDSRQIGYANMVEGETGARLSTSPRTFVFFALVLLNLVYPIATLFICSLWLFGLYRKNNPT